MGYLICFSIILLSNQEFVTKVKQSNIHYSFLPFHPKLKYHPSSNFLEVKAMSFASFVYEACQLEFGCYCCSRYVMDSVFSLIVSIQLVSYRIGLIQLSVCGVQT